jgi:peptidoglycan L-alanyl-D-glutamate endopeptidase CwlK
MYSFGMRSKGKLEGVHPDLVKVMEAAITNSPYDFGITEGVRTPERQRALYQDGKSLTMNSRHLTGHAVDIAVWNEGKLSWDFPLYEEVATHILKVAEEMNVPLIWGGMWRGLRDGPHFELPRKQYE